MIVYSWQDEDMIKKIAGVYAIPPIYVIINKCDTVEEDDEEVFNNYS